ncbi:fatty acid biosynthesis transcriptional regulator FabT [Lactococcus insecticola]|uniref:Transcriptional regulator n=1 Tax=Pseudolactococcus insecticola TaxID=2709158 RepID=A0A6A0B4N6_9LACT|nr:MarR family transcriptional regulator [Lactococcus insecticola]GFH39655.1 transcriptional regulator [Lactococcus insecticola]
MTVEYEKINKYLTHIFNNVLVIEEASLRTSQFSDVSIKEMHTIDSIGEAKVTTPSDIAKDLMLTVGTVTVSLNRLEKKGYIERYRSESDRRVVHVSLSRRGRLLYRLHHKFHREMVKRFVADMPDDSVKILQTGLENLHNFLEEIK